MLVYIIDEREERDTRAFGSYSEFEIESLPTRAMGKSDARADTAGGSFGEYCFEKIRGEGYRNPLMRSISGLSLSFNKQSRHS
jgi:hypothetical protein